MELWTKQEEKTSKWGNISEFVIQHKSRNTASAAKIRLFPVRTFLLLFLFELLLIWCLGNQGNSLHLLLQLLQFALVHLDGNTEGGAQLSVSCLDSRALPAPHPKHSFLLFNKLCLRIDCSLRGQGTQLLQILLVYYK